MFGLTAIQLWWICAALVPLNLWAWWRALRREWTPGRGFDPTDFGAHD